MIDQKTIGNKIEDETPTPAAEARCTLEQTSNDEGSPRDLQIYRGLAKNPQRMKRERRSCPQEVSPETRV
jgi:hypothetical protein